MSCLFREIGTLLAGPRHDAGQEHRHREARSAVAISLGAPASAEANVGVPFGGCFVTALLAMTAVVETKRAPCGARSMVMALVGQAAWRRLASRPLSSEALGFTSQNEPW